MAKPSKRSDKENRVKKKPASKAKPGKSGTKPLSRQGKKNARPSDSRRGQNKLSKYGYSEEPHRQSKKKSKPKQRGGGSGTNKVRTGQVHG